MKQEVVLSSALRCQPRERLLEPPSGKAERRSGVVLSEHEQRLLEQMEQAFRVECPDLDASLDGRRSRRERLRLGVAVLIVLAGVVVLLVGVVVPVVWLGVAGFVVMLAGSVFGFVGGRSVGVDDVALSGGGGLMSRLEGRRRRRRRRGGDPDDDRGGLPARV